MEHRTGPAAGDVGHGGRTGGVGRRGFVKTAAAVAGGVAAAGYVKPSMRSLGVPAALAISGDGLVKLKGNNGVSKGLDSQPPGNPPINDGPGTGPGTPGNKGGNKD